jgi:TolA-binding protein
MRRHVTLVAGLSLILASCAGRSPAPSTGGTIAQKQRAPREDRLVMEPIQLLARPGANGPSIEVLDANGLFERGGQLLSAKKYQKAVAVYDKLLRNFPGSRYISPSLYNAGLAHEWLNQFAKAVERYRELMRRFGSSKEAIDAAFRLGGCYAELHNWPASAEAFNALLKRKDLSASDRIECLARKGLAHFRLGDTRSTRSTLQAAIDFHKSVESIERLDTDFFLGMARYYLAAMPHVEFRNLKVESKDLAKTLDEKARLLILSQAGYIAAINVRNPYWATAAGFQIGSLYREFYTVLMTTLPDFKQQASKTAKLSKVTPKAAEQQLVQVYLEEVHKAVKPLLTKAIRVFEKNVLMGETVGIRSDWVHKSRTQINELKHLLSLPPAQAAKIVTKEQVLPEDQPGTKTDDKKPNSTDPNKKDDGSPDKAPARPTDKPAEQDGDEPGRVIL